MNLNSISMSNSTSSSTSDEAILKASGRTWSQWMSELESKSFSQWSKKDRLKMLRLDYGLSNLWASRVDAAYAACMSDPVCALKAQFGVSISKTFHYPVGDVYDRAMQWFESENRVQLRDIQRSKRLHGDWLTDDSRIDVVFHAKGTDKTQIVVQHEKLTSETDIDIMRNFWKQQLDQMVESL